MIEPRKLVRPIRFVILAAAVITVGLWWGNRPEYYRVPKGDYSLMPLHPPGSELVVQRVGEDYVLRKGTDVVFSVEVEGERFDRLGRVRGLPGDNVSSMGGYLAVNSMLVGPPRIRGDALGKVPEGCVLVLATSDKDTSQLDSRRFGFIPRERVWGIILK